MCVITRNICEKSLLLRFVTGPDGSLVEDVTGKLPGRGCHVFPSRDNLTKLLKRSGVRGAAVEVQLLRIERVLLRRLLDGLKLARRAGDLRWGLRAVKDLVDSTVRLGDNQASMLWLLAADSASNTREKFERQRRKMALVTKSDPEVFELLDRDSFGEVCGGNEVAVLIVHKDGMVRRVRADIVRLQSFLV
jgi:uncharacterized protein